MNKRIAAGINGQWGIFILALLLIAGVLAYNLKIEHQRTLNSEGASLQGRIAIVGANIREKFETTDQALLALRLAHKQKENEVNTSLQVLVNSMPGIRTINIIDANGIVTHSNRTELIGKDFSQREYFTLGKNSTLQDQLMLSPPFETALNAWGMNLTRVRLTTQGKFGGVVSATLQPEYFKALLESIAYAPDMWVSLAHDAGIRFMAIPESVQPKGARLDKPGSFFTRHTESGRVENILKGTLITGGKERVMALHTLKPSAPLLDHGLIIAASREIDAILANWQADALRTTISFGLFSVIATILMILFQRYQAQQNRQLKRAEIELRLREQNLRSILDNLPAKVGNWDKSLRNRFANRAYLEWFNLSEESMRGMHISDVLGEQLYRRNKQYLDAALAGKPQLFERDIIRIDGQTYCGLVSYIPDVRDGEIDGIYVMITDISSLKATEAALRASEARFRELFEHSPIAYLSHDAQGNIIDVNARLCHLLGFLREDLINHLFAEFWPSDKKELYQDLFEKFVESGKCNIELELENNEGELVTLLVDGSVQRDFQGNFVRTHCVLHDISERKHAETSLAESQSMLANMVDSAMDAIITADQNHKVLIFNRAAEVMFGYISADIIGKSIEELIPVRFRHGHGARMRQFAETEISMARNMGGAKNNREVFGVRADGVEFPIEASISHISYGGQQIYTVVVRDITERKQSATKLLELNERLEIRVQERTLELARAKQQAEAASRTKSDFLANMSHEIRTPLNSVLGMTHLALQTELSTQQRDYLEKINFSGTHLLGIINDILDFSKIEAGKLELEIYPFDLKKCLAQTKNLVSERAEAKGLKFEIEVSSQVPAYVYGDALRVNQVLLNLTANAIKFTSHGSIRIRVLPGEEASLRRFEIIDTGIGIDDSARTKLFQSFQQADTSTTRKYGGTGLGLAICKQLVELMGGNIGIYSTPGLGSTFWFTLPLPAATESSLANFGQSIDIAPDKHSLANKRLLVADDHPFNQQIAQEMLEEAGATVCIANNGREALALIEQTHFDALLLDIQMPELDGYETARMIRLKPELSTLPIIAMTANASAADQRRCLASGMNDFISKPVSPSQLIRVLVHHLNTTATGQESAMNTSNTGNSAFPGINANLIDLNILASMVGTDPARINKFAAKFVASTEEGLEAIRQLLAQDKFKDIASYGHRLKSVARTVGALSLADQLEGLEHNAEQLSGEEISARFNSIIHLFEKIRTELAAHSIAVVQEPKP